MPFLFVFHLKFTKYLDTNILLVTYTLIQNTFAAVKRMGGEKTEAKDLGRTTVWQCRIGFFSQPTQCDSKLSVHEFIEFFGPLVMLYEGALCWKPCVAGRWFGVHSHTLKLIYTHYQAVIATQWTSIIPVANWKNEGCKRIQIYSNLRWKASTKLIKTWTYFSYSKPALPPK